MALARASGKALVVFTRHGRRLASSSTNTAATAESSTAETPKTEPEGPKRAPPAEPHARPAGFVRAPYTRTTRPAHKPLNMILEEFPNEGDATGFGARLDDYYRIGDYVRGLATPAERIDFVNPYERPWTRFEKRWHRAWHPTLTSPRKAWAIPPLPTYFDSLAFYQYITKTRVTSDRAVMDHYYASLVPPTKKFEGRVCESLSIMNDRIQSAGPLDEDERKRAVDAFLLAVMDDAQLSIAHNYSFNHFRQSTNPRCESFWVRGGFGHMYEKKDVWDVKAEVDTVRKTKPKFVGDDRRKLGELAFVMRDRLTSQIRSKKPLPVVAAFKDAHISEAAIFDSQIDVKEDVLFSPRVYNLWPDGQPLWQCPGYEPEKQDPFKHGHVAIKSIEGIEERLAHWGLEEGTTEYEAVTKEALTATAVSSLFTWLNAQAHCNGNTQYNDIEGPLVSQLILSDGKKFFFAVGQLNTIAINVEMEGFVNRRVNLALVDGPYNLYDDVGPDGEVVFSGKEGREADAETRLNPHVLSRILQTLMVGRD